MSEPLVVLVGPTAVGKTSLAVELCRRFGAEVVSADSVQVYRGLDIGSAKPTPAERAAAPHHLIDVVDPEEEFDAARFAALADAAIADIRARGRRVLVAGGTGLYVRALLYGLAPLPPVDRALRERLAAQWEALGPEAMHARLAELDPECAARLHPHDRQRVLRALEVCIQTGRPLSQHQAAHGFRRPRYDFLAIGITRPRQELARRIEARCRQMWEQGLVEEVRRLLARGVPPRARSLGSLGYAQVVRMLAGELTPAEALAEQVHKTRAYAKRQLTWFRAMEGIHWHSADDWEGVVARVARVWPPGGES